jgi:hypothetical protein
MNVRLLRRIAKVIQEKPKEFDMSYWHTDRTDGIADSLCGLPKDRRVGCSTSHCIAGWAQVLSTKRDCAMHAEDDAQRILGLTAEQSDRLFYVGGATTGGWPQRFRGRKYEFSPTAKQAAARIEWFIKTKGAE